MHKKEKDPKATTLLLACIMKKKRMAIREICTAPNKSYSTIRNWLVRIDKGGLKRRYDKKKPESQSRMNPDQSKELRADVNVGPQQCGFESGAWTGPLVATHTSKKYGIKYAMSAIYRLLHKMKFSCRKPQAKTPKISLKIRDKGVQKESCKRHE